MARKERRNHKLDHKLNIKTEDLIKNIHDNDVDIKSNHVYLMGIESYEMPDQAEPGIEYIMANRFIRNINICMRVNPKKPIVVHMKSGGGYYGQGMAIYDTIRACPCPITILNYTEASSMTSIILQAANKRVMMPHSHFMFHDGSLVVDGTMKQVKSALNFEKRSETIMMNIYSACMHEHGVYANKPYKTIKAWLRNQMDKKEDVYLTAEEAVKYGFADEIFDYNWANLTKYTQKQLDR